MSPYPRPARTPIPDAVAAVIAAVVAENPLTPPTVVGRLVADALAAEGWRVEPEPPFAPVIASPTSRRAIAPSALRTPVTH